MRRFGILLLAIGCIAGTATESQAGLWAKFNRYWGIYTGPGRHAHDPYWQGTKTLPGEKMMCDEDEPEQVKPAVEKQSSAKFRAGLIR